MPPSDERGEILQPSLLAVPDYSGQGVETTRDHYCVRDGIRDGASSTVMNIVTNISNDNLTAINTYTVVYLSGKPGSWLPSLFTNVVVLSL